MADLKAMRNKAEFQSTPPARGATGCHRGADGAKHISIHAPRKGSDQKAFDVVKQVSISIHAPRKGSDGNRIQNPIDYLGFQSTPPARGATLPILRR